MFKLMMYLKRASEEKLPIQKERNAKLLKLRTELVDWTKYNEEVVVCG